MTPLQPLLFKHIGQLVKAQANICSGFHTTDLSTGPLELCGTGGLIYAAGLCNLCIKKRQIMQHDAAHFVTVFTSLFCHFYTC